MNLTFLSSVLSAKALAIVGAAAAVGTGGGLAVASVAAGNHTTQLATVSADSHPAAPQPDASESSDSADTPDAAASSHANAPVVPTVTCTATNHGAYVKSVAQSPEPSGAPANQHGMDVSAAAKSSCGKPTQAGGPDVSNDNSTGKPTTPNSHANPAASTGQSHATAGSGNATTGSDAATNHKPASPGAQAGTHPADSSQG